jgi:hypothetical protein
MLDPMKLVSLVAALGIAACSKGAETKGAEATTGETKPAPHSDWAKDRPAAISAESIAVVDSLTATYNANKAGLESGDCAKIAVAFEALTPDTKRISDEADKVDAIAAKDPAAKTWLDATFNPRVAIVLTGIKVSMKSTSCRSNPAWERAVMGWVLATGFVPPAQ